MFELQRRGSNSWDPRCPSLARNMDFKADRRGRIILIGRAPSPRACPVVREGGFPNDHVVRESGHGSVVPAGDLDALAEQVDRWIQSEASPARAVNYIMQQHTWDHRARVYAALLRESGMSRD